MQGALELTAEQARVLQVLQDGRDPLVWATKVLGVKLNPAQRRWFRLIRPDKDGWKWRYKAVCHVAANQIGKTLGLAILILWAGWYKIGIPMDDPKAWQDAPYQWFHIAPSQQQAYFPLTDAKLLLKGVHPAQTTKGPHVRVLDFVRQQVQETKVEHYYDGLTFWNGAVVQFRTSENKARALLGYRAHGISFDECAFEDHLNEEINEVLMMRLISTGGPLWMVSTPNGINDWFEIITSIQEEAAPRLEATDPEDIGGSCLAGEPLPVWVTPDRWALLWSTIADNMGFGIDEVEAARMERDLDPATKEQQLRGAFLEPADAFFVPSSLIDQAFTDLIPEMTPPKAGHRYVVSWDPSATTDPTVCIVIDITKEPWRGVYWEYHLKPMGELELVNRMYAVHALYNGGATERVRGTEPPRAITTWDSTSMGGALIGHNLADLFPKVPFNLAGTQAKTAALQNLRTALGSKLKIPKSWTRVRREVLTYKLPDEKIRQDTVMALAGAASVAASGWSGKHISQFQPHGRIVLR